MLISAENKRTIVLAGGSCCIEQAAHFSVAFCCIQQGACKMPVGGLGIKNKLKLNPIKTVDYQYIHVPVHVVYDFVSTHIIITTMENCT